VCLWLWTSVVYNTEQNSSDNLPSYLQTNATAQMLSIRGEGYSLPTTAAKTIHILVTTSSFNCFDFYMKLAAVSAANSNKGLRPGNFFLKLIYVDFCVGHTGGAAKIAQNVVSTWRLQHILSLHSHHKHSDNSTGRSTKLNYHLGGYKFDPHQIHCKQQFVRANLVGRNEQ